ncbi:hypothetical protein [Streptomyces viridochromogenes]|uniref:hypothetical protein n=1 Tax=Streptomyces viridochromogenes TaxID=1938 RepID=UPI00131E4F8B|nr:hypothetical protein [Streptomyces viridochromogenes]
MHHELPSFGAPSATGLIPTVIVLGVPEPSNELTLDFAHIRARARAAVGGVSHYDLKIHLPDGRVLAWPLEDAPDSAETFSTDQPPEWLQAV